MLPGKQRCTRALSVTGTVIDGAQLDGRCAVARVDN